MRKSIVLIPEDLKGPDNLKLPIKLILVIPSIPDGDLTVITETFRRKLNIERKLWGINYSDILVLNERLARKYKLVV